MVPAMRIPILVLSSILLLPSAVAQETATVRSPDGNLEIAFQTVNEDSRAASAGQLVYEVSFHGKPALAWSKLGLQFQGRPPLGESVKVEVAGEGSRVESYELVHGKTKSVRHEYNWLHLEAVESGRNARRFIIEARAFDDAVAFRYLVPEQGSQKDFRLAEELTEFRLPQDCPSYPLFLNSFRTSYEDRYVMRPVSRIASFMNA